MTCHRQARGGALHARSENRTGFTSLEVLTLIAVVGLLAALILPSVQAARDAVQRNRFGRQPAASRLGPAKLSRRASAFIVFHSARPQHDFERGGESSSASNQRDLVVEKRPACSEASRQEGLLNR